MVEGSAIAYCVCGLSKDYNYLQLDYFFTIGKRWILDYFVYTMLSPLFRSGVRGAWGGGGGGGFGGVGGSKTFFLKNSTRTSANESKRRAKQCTKITGAPCSKRGVFPSASSSV
jgi:hypothetical protein